MTLVFGSDGQGFYLHSPCELQRFSLSTKAVVQPNCILELPEGMRPEPELEPEPEVANTEESADTAKVKETELKEEPAREEEEEKKKLSDDQTQDDKMAKDNEETAE